MMPSDDAIGSTPVHHPCRMPVIRLEEMRFQAKFEESTFHALGG
jgi:hypothetical protein